MRRALQLAREGWGRTAPNPMVGAVLVRDGAVVGEGAHEEFGTPHAEINALARAGEKARGATLYVTLEPCNHHGKTPPCTQAIVAAGVSRVVFAVADPTPAADGGTSFLNEHGVKVETGVEADSAAELIAPFLFAARSTRPFVTLKLALSAEGGMSDRDRSRKWLTSDESREEVHRLRAQADAIAVGAGTVKVDNPELTVRGKIVPRINPSRVVFDRHGEMPMTSKLVRTARQIPTIVITSPGSGIAGTLRESGVTVIERADSLAALEDLRALEIRHLFVEGGISLARDLLADGLVDRLVIFQTRIPLGKRSEKPYETVDELNVQRIVERARFGNDEMTVYALSSR